MFEPQLLNTNSLKNKKTAFSSNNFELTNAASSSMLSLVKKIK